MLAEPWIFRCDAKLYTDDPDVELFLDHVKHLLLDKYGARGMDISSFSLMHSLEHKSFLRCLATLQSVMVLDGAKNAEPFVERFWPYGNGLSGSIIDEDSMGGRKKLAGPSGLEDSLQIWGARLVEEFARARTPTGEVVAWIRTLLLAGNAYSVS